MASQLPQQWRAKQAGSSLAGGLGGGVAEVASGRGSPVVPRVLKGSDANDRDGEQGRHRRRGSAGESARKAREEQERKAQEEAERKAKELEEQNAREEAERSAQEEAARRARENEEAAARAEEAQKAAETKRAAREANLAPARPDANFFKTLDSSVKRNTAVIKKLKQLSEEQRESILDDIRAVNLSKYVTEAVHAVAEAKLKTADINAAVQVCSLLHQRYKEFSPNLVATLAKTFEHVKGVADDVDRTSKVARKRTVLRLLTDLYIYGVYTDASVLVGILKDVTSPDQLKDRESTQGNLSLLVSFARHAKEVMGLVPTRSEGLSAAVEAELLTPEEKKAFSKLLNDYYDAVSDVLQQEHKALRKQEAENARALSLKGELSEETSAVYDKLRKSYEQLLRNVTSLAEALDRDPPSLPEDENMTRMSASADGSQQPLAAHKEHTLEPVWDEDDSRAFYEDLPDLRAFVPAVLLGDSEPKAGDKGDQENALDGHKEESEAEKGDVKKKGEADAGKEKVKGVDSASLEALLQRLPGAVSRDLIDQISVDFCYLNSKASRKKLVRALFAVPRTALNLLPYYARMAATLSSCMKDMAPSLLALLEEEFNSLLLKKDLSQIESKTKNVRFLGELAKFKVAPPGLIFNCLKAFLDDFTGTNIDAACHLLETCGRFLYRTPETSVRTGNMLDILMRLKNAKNLDSRQSTTIENAYYQCKPPERSARVVKERPPLHQYIRKLVRSDLERTTIEHVLKQLRKLPWVVCGGYVRKVLLRVYKVKYSHVHLVASLVAGLSRYHDELAVNVVDEVLEEVRVGLEVNEYSMQQRRVAFMHFLGELYNYRVVDSPIIFETLYLILNFGQGTPEEASLDPSEDAFRIRLVITLLSTCGQYFDRGSSKKKLDRFLLYFQRYILSKPAIPIDVEFDLQDLFLELRPRLVRFSTYEAAHEAVADSEKAEQEALASKSRGAAQLNASPPTLGTLATSPTQSFAPESDSEESGSELGDDASDGESTVAGDEGGDEQEEDGADEAAGQLEMEEPEEETVRVRQRREVDPDEEAAFEREYRALMQESLDARKLEVRKGAGLNMAIPMNLFDAPERGRQADSDTGSGPEEGPSDSVSFRLLVKKGNKQATKQIQVPVNCSLAVSTKAKEEAELQEKKELKRLVLEYNSREEDDRSTPGLQPINRVLLSTSGTLGRGGHSARQRRPVPAGARRR